MQNDKLGPYFFLVLYFWVISKFPIQTFHSDPTQLMDGPHPCPTTLLIVAGHDINLAQNFDKTSQYGLKSTP